MQSICIRCMRWFWMTFYHHLKFHRNRQRQSIAILDIFEKLMQKLISKELSCPVWNVKIALFAVCWCKLIVFHCFYIGIFFPFRTVDTGRCHEPLNQASARVAFTANPINCLRTQSASVQIVSCHHLFSSKPLTVNNLPGFQLIPTRMKNEQSFLRCLHSDINHFRWYWV